MTRISLSHSPNFLQTPLSKKGDFFHSSKNASIKRERYRQFFQLKRGHHRINLKNPHAWASFVYHELQQTYRNTFDFLRSLEIFNNKKKSDGWIYISDMKLAQLMGYSLRTAERHIKRLVDCGLLWRHTYKRSKIAKGGSERVMCTYMNIDQFREKHIHKYRKWNPLHKKCIHSFNQYNQDIIRYQQEFCREELEETALQIASEKARNECEINDQKAYQILESGINDLLYEDDGCISDHPLRGNTAIYIQENSPVFHHQLVERIGQKGYDPPLRVSDEERTRSLETEIIDQWLKSTRISCPNHALASIERDRTKQLQVIDAMCERQSWLKDKREMILRAFKAVWTLKHDLRGKCLRKNLIEYAIHAATRGYVQELENRVFKERKTKDDKHHHYSNLLPHLRWDETAYPPPQFAYQSEQYQLAKNLSYELWQKHRETLQKMNIAINEHGIEYLSDTSHVKVKYTDPKIFYELVLRAFNYGYLEIKEFLLFRLKSKVNASN